MLTDILIAFLCALFANCVSLISRNLKCYMVIVFFSVIVVEYFVNNAIGFVGTMDFGGWVVFVVLFYEAIELFLGVVPNNKVKSNRS